MSTGDHLSAEANDTGLYSMVSVAIQQSRSKPHRLCIVGDSARPCLQEPDQGRGRAVAAH